MSRVRLALFSYAWNIPPAVLPHRAKSNAYVRTHHRLGEHLDFPASRIAADYIDLGFSNLQLAARATARDNDALIKCRIHFALMGAARIE